jgi:hypothetical protein
MTDYDLEKFIGEGPDACSIYRTKWRRALLTKMMGRGRPILENGLLPYILQQAEYVKHVATGANFVELTMPQALQGTPGNYATAEFTALRAGFYKQEEEKATAASKIHDALGDTPKQLLLNQHGILETDLKTILKILDENYMRVTKREIDDAVNSLTEKFEPGQDLRKLIAKHKTVHATLAEASEPLPLHFKMNYLIDAVKHTKALSECVDAYMRGQPDRSKHSFDDLAAALTAQIANRPDTVFTMGYANAAPVDSLSRRIEELERMNRDLSARVARAEAGNGNERKLSAAPRRRDSLYCWSHGKQHSHSSNECRYPRQGHQTQATLENQLGGRVATL